MGPTPGCPLLLSPPPSCEKGPGKTSTFVSELAFIYPRGLKGGLTNFQRRKRDVLIWESGIEPLEEGKAVSDTIVCGWWRAFGRPEGPEVGELSKQIEL